jgi:hypothetical protein
MCTQDVKEVDSSAIMEVAANVGAVDSQAKPIAMAVLNDLNAANRLTPEERKDYQVLEKKFRSGQRGSLAALREIRERKLYREDYATFDAYMAGRWYRTRQWATQNLNWLRCMELLEASGKNSYHLNVDDAQALVSLEEDPELYVQALEEAEEEAQRAGKKRTTKLLQQAVKRRTEFLSASAHLGMPDLTYDESKALNRLGLSRKNNPNLVAEAQAKAEAEIHPLDDCLAEVCQSHHALPTDKQLLAAARGKDLDALVQPLAALKSEWDKKAALAEKRRKLKDDLDEIDEQIAPPPERAQPQRKRALWLGPESSPAAAPEDEEPQEAAGPACRVQLTGAFERIATGCFFGGGAEMQVDADSLPELLSLFAESIGEGFLIEEESSITVIPLATDEADDDEDDATEEPEEDVEHDGDNEAGDE